MVRPTKAHPVQHRDRGEVGPVPLARPRHVSHARRAVITGADGVRQPVGLRQGRLGQCLLGQRFLADPGTGATLGAVDHHPPGGRVGPHQVELGPLLVVVQGDREVGDRGEHRGHQHLLRQRRGQHGHPVHAGLGKHLVQVAFAALGKSVDEAAEVRLAGQDPVPRISEALGGALDRNAVHLHARGAWPHDPLPDHAALVLADVQVLHGAHDGRLGVQPWLGVQCVGLRGSGVGPYLRVAHRSGERTVVDRFALGGDGHDIGLVRGVGRELVAGDHPVEHRLRACDGFCGCPAHADRPLGRHRRPQALGLTRRFAEVELREVVRARDRRSSPGGRLPRRTHCRLRDGLCRRRHRHLGDGVSGRRGRAHAAGCRWVSVAQHGGHVGREGGERGGKHFGDLLGGAAARAENLQQVRLLQAGDARRISLDGPRPPSLERDQHCVTLVGLRGVWCRDYGLRSGDSLRLGRGGGSGCRCVRLGRA